MGTIPKASESTRNESAKTNFRNRLTGSAAFRAAVLLLCAGGTALYVAAAARSYLSFRASQTGALAGRERAIRLAPHDAQYHDALGRYRLFVDGEVPGALAALRRATELNPYDSRYWLDLATAYQIAGDTVRQRESLEAAVAADPNGTTVAWEAGTFYLALGDLDRAFPLLQIVAREESSSSAAAMEAVWRASHDVQRVLRDAVPPTVAAHAALLDDVIRDDCARCAADVWNHLVALPQPPDAAIAGPYLDFLIAQGDGASASAVWQQITAANPDLRLYAASDGNRVANGGFEGPLLNTGLDWRYQELRGVTLAIDTSEFHGGSRALQITFERTSGAMIGPSQYVPVQPRTRYHFSAYLRAEDLLTASGPRFAVWNASSRQNLLVTPEITGSTGWRELAGEFDVPADVSIVLVRLVRDPGEQLISGKLWVDDVRIERLAAPGAVSNGESRGDDH